MKAVILEDESLIAKELQNKIMSVADDITVIEILPSLKTAKKWFMQNAEPDLIFMDIQLSDGVSFELFDIYKLNCPVVFTTAYDEYALKAFKVNGVDYLLKPVDEEELKRAIKKCRDIIESKSSMPIDIQQLVKNLKQGNNQPLYKEKFIVSMRNNWIPVNTKDIACFMRENLNYLFTFTGDKYILDFTTLEEVEELLDPQKFYRANRQYIVNINYVKGFKAYEKVKLLVELTIPELSHCITISQETAPAFRKWMYEA